MRIRRQAKWLFAVMVLVFAGAFVIFQVGSGSTGIGDLLHGNLGIFGNSKSSSNTPSINAALKKLAKHPNDAAAQLQLAQAYVRASRTDDAIGAYTTYLNLRPKNVDALRELSSLYYQRAQTQSVDAQAAAAEAQASQPFGFGPAPNTKIGQALGSSSDPITQATVGAANTSYNQAVTALQATFREIESIDQRITAAEPTDAPSVLTLAQDAQRAGDTATAIQAYKRFLVLAPDDPSAPLAKQQIKQLSSQTHH